ncbi:MAG: hypothetical protein WD054_03900, partial [Gemmatimonadota bacterium]
MFFCPSSEVMSVSNWILWLVLSTVAVGLSLWQYRRRETPGRGRGLLAALRAAALCLLLILLLDPTLPGSSAGQPGGTQMLLDASLSMMLPADADADGTPADADETRWQAAAALARSRAGDRPILLFGDAPRAAAPDALPDVAPGDTRSRLLPALQAAAEAGVRHVVVVTDGGIEDADAVARWLPRLGLEVETRLVGAELVNRTLAEVSAPQWVEAGSVARVEFGVAAGGAATAGRAGSGAGADSLRVVARQAGRVVGRAAVAPPGAGRLATASL